jgi:hypothetical protein
MQTFKKDSIQRNIQNSHVHTTPNGTLNNAFYFSSANGQSKNTKKEHRLQDKDEIESHRRKKSIIYLMVAEILVVVAYLITIFVWTSVSIPWMFGLLSLLHAIHSFSWFSAYGMTRRNKSMRYSMLYTVIYAISLLFDVISFVIHVIIISVCGTEGCPLNILGYEFSPIYTNKDFSYVLATLIISVFFIVIDSFMIHYGILEARKIKTDIRMIVEHENQRTDGPSIFILDTKEVSKTKKVLRALYPLELAFFVFIVIFISLGVGVTTLFSWLVLACLPHGILWIAVYALAGSRDGLMKKGEPSDGMIDYTYMVVSKGIAIVSAIFSSAAALIALIVLLVCQFDTSCYNSSDVEDIINLVLSWFIFIFFLALSISSILICVYVFKLGKYLGTQLENLKEKKL